jgi:hypothetical protein
MFELERENEKANNEMKIAWRCEKVRSTAILLQIFVESGKDLLSLDLT